MNLWPVNGYADFTSILDGTADVVATDVPMTDEQLKQARGRKILHIPTAVRAIVPTYNIPAVTEPLKFTAETLAGIFLGEITWWNDPRLVADNPDANLPRKGILVVHRSDDCGSSFIWTDYLATVSPRWRGAVGVGTSVPWPVGLGVRGDAGVAGAVKQNENAIGYLQRIHAMRNQLPLGLVKNGAGLFVEPSLEAMTAAAAALAETIPTDLRASIVNAPGEKAYPIASFNWVLVRRAMKDKATATNVARLLWWVIHEGQKHISGLGYAPLPDAMVKKAEQKIRSITGAGRPALSPC